MFRFKFGKLVRDKIIDQQVASGARPHYRNLSQGEHVRALIDKIAEEAAEIMEASPDNVAGEIADVQQVIDDLVYTLGLAPGAVRHEQEKKKEKAGAFQRGYYIDYVEVDDDNAWVPYYRKHPGRYPEMPSDE